MQQKCWLDNEMSSHTGYVSVPSRTARISASPRYLSTISTGPNCRSIHLLHEYIFSQSTFVLSRVDGSNHPSIRYVERRIKNSIRHIGRQVTNCKYLPAD